MSAWSTAKERLVPTVICEWISDQAKEEIAEQLVSDEDTILKLIAEDPSERSRAWP